MALPPRDAPDLFWRETAQLSWHYINPGDFNQDKLIAVTDITYCALGLGQYWENTSPDFPDPFPTGDLQSVIDANENGMIEVGDLTPLGQNYDRGVDEYRVYSGGSSAWPDGGNLVATIPFDDFVGDPTIERIYYTYQLPVIPDGLHYWVTPVHRGEKGVASAPLEHAIAGYSGQIDIRLASMGCATGDLAVRIFAPEAGSEYFTAGAPVVITVPGGKDSHTVEDAAMNGLESFVNVSFSFPGVGLPPYDSGGFDDSRGENVVRALRDVTRYCLGMTTDADGYSLQQITDCNVLYDNVGYAALSNGGCLATATLGYYGDVMSGLAWFVGWENPTCSQAVNGDAGPGKNRINADPGAPKAQYVNPAYNGWGTTDFDIDLTGLAYDAYPLDPLEEMIYLERGGLARFDVVPFPGGGQTSDLDIDDVIGPGEDWGFEAWQVDGKLYYSLPVVQAIWDLPLFAPGSEPVWLPTVAQAAAFWAPREAAPYYDTIAPLFPDLKVILCCTVEDHVQKPVDHPHIHQAFDGFNRNGLAVKLNPSPEVLVARDPLLSGRTDLPDYDFGEEPADWSVTDYCVPEDVLTNLSAAAAMELAEIVQAQ